MRLLTSGDAAKELGLSRDRVIQLEREGELRAMRDSAGRRLFKPRDVERLRRSREEDRRE